MSDIDAYFGKSVRAFRSAANLSQREFAKALSDAGMTADASSISRIESGERSVRLNEAQTIADILRCGVGDLIDCGSGADGTSRAKAVIDLAIAELTALRDEVAVG